MTKNSDSKEKLDLDDISKRLEKAKKDLNIVDENTDQRSSSSIGRHMWIAFNVVSELLGGIICGFLIGYFLDYKFETKPIFICIFLLIGSIAGVLNTIRYINNYEKNNSLNEKE